MLQRAQAAAREDDVGHGAVEAAAQHARLVDEQVAISHVVVHERWAGVHATVGGKLRARARKELLRFPLVKQSIMVWLEVVLKVWEPGAY